MSCGIKWARPGSHVTPHSNMTTSQYTSHTTDGQTNVT